MCEGSYNGETERFQFWKRIFYFGFKLNGRILNLNFFFKLDFRGFWKEVLRSLGLDFVGFKLSSWRIVE
jgi:hypothetical protein